MIFAIALVTLAVLLAAKVLAEGSQSEFGARLAGYLTVPIIPLLIFFILTVIFTIADVLA